MTCPLCEREGVALVGGICGHCSSRIASVVNEAIEPFVDGELPIQDVGLFDYDEFLHVRLDPDAFDTGEAPADDKPGGYDTVDGLRERAEHLGNPLVVALVDGAEDRVEDTGAGYTISPPEDSAPDSLAMVFHLGVLTGAALEREYPAPIRGGGDA